MKAPPFVMKCLIAAVHIVIDLGNIEVADSCGRIVENRDQVSSFHSDITPPKYDRYVSIVKSL